MDDGMAELSAEAIIRTSGWHPGYARVLLIEQAGDFAVVLVDGNGDGAELELEYWQRDADGLWRGGSSSGYGSLYMSGATAGAPVTSWSRSGGYSPPPRSAFGMAATSTGAWPANSEYGALSTRPTQLTGVSCRL